MVTNVKLALKVLRQMDEDFIRIEASLLNVQNEEQKIALFKEIRDHRIAVDRLKNYFQRLLVRQS